MMKWISVFHGPTWKVSIVQARLQDLGFQTWVPDPTLKVIDPFITGGGTALDAELQVPEDAAAAALAEVERFAVEREHRAAAAHDDPVFGSQAAYDLYRLGRRIRWATWFWATAPVALWLAPKYFLRVRQLGLRPPAHGYVIVATVVAALITCFFVYLFAFPFVFAAFH